VQISIMVLDNDGNHVYMDRMDGQGYPNIVTAEMKARTALMGREPSKNRMNRVIQDPAEEFQQIQLGFFPISGGLPIVLNKRLIGAVGVGGSTPRVPAWSDEICAHKALVEVIGPSAPPLVQDLPPRQNPNPGNAPVPRFVAATPPKSSLPAEFVVGGKAGIPYLMAIRFRSQQLKKSPASVAIGRRRRAVRCRSTSSIMPGSSCTWSAWTAKSTTTSAPRY
jgi:uncharacterized protein GlcG (DUF336 family)